MTFAISWEVPDCAVGHVLVQRNEDDPLKRPVFFYKKFPPDIKHRQASTFSHRVWHEVKLRT